MTWPIEATTKDAALASVDRAAGQIKAKATALRTKSAAGDITAYEITIDLLPRLKSAATTFANAASISGMAAYVAGQSGVTEQAVIDAFNDMSGAVTGVISWIEDNLPASGGYLLIEQITSDDTGTITPRIFSSAATSGFRTVLQALEDTIG